MSDNSKKYGRPCMTNLPYELGKAIFEEMDNAPVPDHKAMREEARKLGRQMLESRISEEIENRYGKPCLTNLPKDLYDQIVEEIMNAPSNREEVKRKSMEFKMKVMNMEKDENTSE